MKVSIVGCGWLGLPLGKHLVDQGHEVIGSTTRQERFEDLKTVGIQPVLLKLQPMPFGIEFNQLFETDCLIINIPPSQREVDPSFYEEQIKYLKYFVEQFNVQKVIFVSSTSYYPNTNAEVNESTPYDFDKGSSKAVVQGEKQIRQVKSELLVLRCAGLMGQDRIPGKWFAGKKTNGANTPVNYIHRDDVIRIISKLIMLNSWTTNTLNLVSPEHPTRREVHEAMAEKHGFKKPIWSDPSIIPHKKVTSRINAVLGYDFKYESPLFF
jgi:nucleoside-diphosphate-sugar epimerase